MERTYSYVFCKFLTLFTFIETKYQQNSLLMHDTFGYLNDSTAVKSYLFIEKVKQVEIQSS